MTYNSMCFSNFVQSFHIKGTKVNFSGYIYIFFFLKRTGLQIPRSERWRIMSGSIYVKAFLEPNFNGHALGLHPQWTVNS